MNGSGRRNNEKDSKEGEGSSGGWTSTFLKVAGAVAATAAVAGSLYTILKQPEANDMVAPYGVRRAHRREEEEEEEEEEVILHVDGSLLPTSAGCGGYLSSKSQKWICGFTQKLNPNLHSAEAETEAILRGLLWVQEKGLKKVVVKNDCKTVVEECLNPKYISKDPTNDPICKIKKLLDNYKGKDPLLPIRGVNNKVADRLAHKAHSNGFFDLQQIYSPPHNCLELLALAP